MAHLSSFTGRRYRHGQGLHACRRVVCWGTIMLLEAVLTLFSQEITGRQRVFPFFLLWIYKKQYQVNNRIAGVEDKKNNSCCINGNSFFST
jgi:hypothetical protein